MKIFFEQIVIRQLLYIDQSIQTNILHFELKKTLKANHTYRYDGNENI